MSLDIMEKRAQYIRRNNELLQEFSFAHPTTKCLISNVFNIHISGSSSMWNPFNNLGMSHKELYSRFPEKHISIQLKQ